MQRDFLAFNPFVAWFDSAFELGASFIAPAPGGTSVFSPMTERQDGHGLFVPASAPRTGAPMVVMLHGAGQDPEDFAAGTAMNTAAERDGFVVLYPAQSPRQNAHRCWNWFDVAHQTRASGEPARIAALTLEVARDRQIDPDRIYVAGLSAGGAMAALLGELFPDVFAAVGVHSGLPARAARDLSSGLAAMRGNARADVAPSRVPTIVFHGDKDMVVSPLNGVQVIEASVGRGCASKSVEQLGSDGRRVTRVDYLGTDGCVCGEHWTLHEAGHAWSGGDKAGSCADPLGPAASEEMLRFFRSHRRTRARRVRAGR